MTTQRKKKSLEERVAELARRLPEEGHNEAVRRADESATRLMEISELTWELDHKWPPSLVDAVFRRVDPLQGVGLPDEVWPRIAILEDLLSKEQCETIEGKVRWLRLASLFQAAQRQYEMVTFSRSFNKYQQKLEEDILKPHHKVDMGRRQIAEVLNDPVSARIFRKRHGPTLEYRRRRGELQMKPVEFRNYLCQKVLRQKVGKYIDEQILVGKLFFKSRGDQKLMDDDTFFFHIVGCLLSYEKGRKWRIHRDGSATPNELSEVEILELLNGAQEVVSISRRHGSTGQAV